MENTTPNLAEHVGEDVANHPAFIWGFDLWFDGSNLEQAIQEAYAVYCQTLEDEVYQY